MDDAGEAGTLRVLKRHVQGEEQEDVGIGKRQRVDEAESNANPRPNAHIFPFLELPGELKNRIYDYAIEEAIASFPCVHRVKKRGRRRSSAPTTRSNSESERSLTHSKPESIAYMALTQVCAQMRADFRPLWMSCHRIGLQEVDQYFRIWFSQAPKKDRDRFNAYYSSEAKLVVSIDHLDDVQRTDILKLLKHKVRFPKYNIVLESTAFGNELALRGLEKILNHKHPLWLHWIKSNIITQVRLEVRNNPDYDEMRIVVKEAHAKDWMKPTLGANQVSSPCREFLASIGLGDMVYWRVYFGVCYP